MANVLSEEKRHQVIALGRLGWSLRRIEATTGVRRETASAYLRDAGVDVRQPGRWGRPPKPANEVTADPERLARGGLAVKTGQRSDHRPRPAFGAAGEEQLCPVP